MAERPSSLAFDAGTVAAFVGSHTPSCRQSVRPPTLCRRRAVPRRRLREGLSANARAGALDQLAAVVDALRTVSLDAARGAGASLRPHQGFGHPSQRELHHRHADLLGAANVERVEALWVDYERCSITGRHPRLVLANADLKPEHVLHDPVTGRLTGVLDWGDACLSHPDFDLAIIGLFFSPDVRDQVAARLGTADSARVTSTARLFVAVRWLTDLDVEVTEGDESFQAYCLAGLSAHLGEA